MNKTTELYRRLENAAHMEWQDALRSGAPDDEVERAYNFWQRVVRLND